MFVQIQCSSCGQPFDYDSFSGHPKAECPHCGKSNDVPLPPSALKDMHVVHDAPALAGVKPCPSCKAQIERDAVLCIHCGYNLASGKKVAAGSAALGGKTLLLGGAALVVLALGAAYLLWPEPDAPPPFVPTEASAPVQPAAAPAATEPAPESPASPTPAPAAAEAPPPAAAEPVAAPPPGPSPETLAAQKAEAERIEAENRKFEAEQDVRIQIDTRLPMYGLNEIVELRRKTGVLHTGTLAGFSGTGTNRLARVATPGGEVGVPLAALDAASRCRLDAEFREAYVQHLVNARLSAPPKEPAAP